MLEEQGSAVERALWSAVRMLQERAVLMSRLAERMREVGNAKSGRHFDERGREAQEQAESIRLLLERPGAAASVAGDRERAA
jgi:hypothetical protein